MKRFFLAACCLALFSFPALAKEKSGAGMSDQQFVDFAAQTDMVEVNLAQMAESSGTPRLKDYAEMLITDHTKDFNQLYDIAHQANLTRPDALDSEHYKTMIEPFEKLKGAAFDRRYIQEMIAGHTKAIATYKKEAADAQNPALKSYAEQTLPALQKHLDDAKALEKAK
jgi:putative membrane protein